MFQQEQVRSFTFSDLLAMQYEGDGTVRVMDGRQTRVMVTVFTRMDEPPVRVVVADATTQAIRARRYFSSLGAAVTFVNDCLVS